MNIENIKYDEKGLVPAIAQDYKTNEVLMLAYMNKESLQISLDEKKACYFSRSRNQLWRKGETSGNIQIIKDIYYDCDKDTILLKIDQIGNACHTGERSCFFNKLYDENTDTQYNNTSSISDKVNNDEIKNKEIINKLYHQIIDRKNNPKEGSYTNYLFEKGLDKILKKVGEETSEVIIGAKNKNKEELVYELCDLVYHSLVLMVNEDISIEDLKKELNKRHK